MKLNKIFIIAAVLMFAFTANIHAQKARFIRANELYDVMAYAGALPRYEKVLKKDSANNEALIKLADCYRRLNNMQKAAKTYEKIISKGIAQPIHKLYYAQALMELGNYDKAKSYMAEYNADARGETFTKSMNDLDKFFKDTAFYKIETLPFNSDLNDFSPRINKDKVVFASSRKRAYVENHINTWTNNGFFKLYYTRKKANGKYKCVKVFPHSVDNRYNAGPVSFSKQSNTVYVTRNNIIDSKLVRAQDGQAKLQIYAASLNKKGTAYQYLVDFQYNNKEYNVMHPAISDDGNRFYFVSDMPGGKGGYDIWMCTRENNAWSAPKNLGKSVNTEGNEAFPFVKGSLLYFSSNGLEGIGGMDIYKVPLDDKGMPSGNVYNMGVPLNSMGDDFGVVFDETGKTGYFSSNRKTLNMDDDIYGFIFKKDEKKDILISGVTTDKESKELMDQTKVTLLDKNNQVIEEVYTNENGNFTFNAQRDQEYTIKGAKEEYFSTEKPVLTATDEKNDVIKEDLDLDKDPKLKLNIVVTDSKTNAPLSNVVVEVTDKLTGKKNKYVTTNTGEYLGTLDKKIGDKVNYSLKFGKDGYYNANSEYTYDIAEKGTVVKISQVMDKILEIEPIYFDFDKYNIRPDAAAKLDHLTELLNENPTWYIELYSFTDCRGTEKYNKDLSAERAKATADYLIAKSITTNRIVGKGMGISKNNIECDCKNAGKSNCTEEQYQLNRRSEFKLIRK